MADTSFICSDHSFLSILQDGNDSPWDPDHNPYHRALITVHFIALLVFVVSSTCGNLSQVDKLWSVLPAFYAWMCVVDTRTTLMAWISTLWAVRLTYNFYRRGGYAYPPWEGEEDYRWEVLRSGTLGGWWRLLRNKWIMLLFNLVFISVYQNYLLLAIAAPSFVAWSQAMRGIHCPSGEGGDESITGVPPPLNFLDGMACFLFVASVIVEAMADNQQYNFQNKKREWKSQVNTGAGSGGFANAIKSISFNTSLQEYEDGFCQSNLFSLVRKPAYAAEQATWISFYLFSVAASYAETRHYWNWSGGGFLQLCLLFQASGWLTERISITKYPKYHLYQKKVPLYVPRISSLWQLIIGKDIHHNKQE
mmetsp:Transcript_27133/g.57265  ORF Transcript_27133/g.57265 Transcript_27133/m.57265 type:complete len:364 (+) Transcript_27133:124-1215(+)